MKPNGKKPPMNFREFAQHKFDVLVLVLMSLFMLSMLVHFAHHQADTQLSEWTMRGADMLLGALIMALTGGRAGFRKNDGNGAAKP